MKKKMIAGNWKMNLSRNAIPQFFTELKSHLEPSWPDISEKIDIVIAAPFTLLDSCVKAAHKSGVQIAAQNVHEMSNGAYTGEISAGMLKEAKVHMTLIAHSERRQYYGESDESALKKIQTCLTNGLQPIFCIGETIREREQNQTAQVIARQLQRVLDSLSDCSGIILAYEPVWAIGSGLAASAEQAQEVHQLIRSMLDKRYGRAAAEATRILYGGSMNPANSRELLLQPDIDGGLIGGASLKAKDFASVILSAC